MASNIPTSHTLTDTKNMFRSLRYRNYRLLFYGQGISLIGTWMQSVAVSWLVYRMTNSAFMLGIVGFAGQIPTFILAPFAGVIADRMNRHRLVILTQVFAMVEAVILSILVITGNILVWQIVALSAFLGIVTAFDIPIRQAFTIELIENKDDLGNAIALNSSAFNLARLIGPSVGGIIILMAGEGLCFVLNAVSYLAVIISLAAMRIKPRKIESRKTRLVRDVKEGLAYAFGFAPIKYIILLVGLASLMGVSYQVLMPVFARDIFRGGAQTLGFLVGMSGLGALAGAIYLAARKSVAGFGVDLASASILFGVGIISFSFSKILSFSMFFVALAGFGMMVQMAASNAILQTISEEDKRGRVISLYAAAFMGMAPIGSLLAGWLANVIGAPITLLINGLFCVAGSIIFARHLPELKKKMRSLYSGKGVLPEFTGGVQQAIVPFEIFSRD